MEGSEGREGGKGDVENGCGEKEEREDNADEEGMTKKEGND